MISQKSGWGALTLLWTGLIFFSSTTAAGHCAEQFFRLIARDFLRPLRGDAGSYELVHFVAEKSVHVCLFLVLAVLLSKALPRKMRGTGFILLIGLVIGCCSEFLQSLFPGRDPALRDVCINAGATAVGAAVALGLRKIQSQSAEARQAAAALEMETAGTHD